LNEKEMWKVIKIFMFLQFLRLEIC